jgi:fumarate reductase subunit D
MARSAKAIPWFLFAAGGTITAFVLPVMLFVTNLAPPLGLFRDAMSWETMSSFVGFWVVKLVLFGIIGFGLWHAGTGCARARTTWASAPTRRSRSSSTASPALARC